MGTRVCCFNSARTEEKTAAGALACWAGKYDASSRSRKASGARRNAQHVTRRRSLKIGVSNRLRSSRKVRKELLQVEPAWRILRIQELLEARSFL